MKFPARGPTAALAVASVGVAGALSAYTLSCLLRLQVWSLELSIPSLPDTLDGTRIAHLSDFHLGKLGTSRRVIAQAIEVAERFDPDITALTGDYFDGRFQMQDVRLLDRLRGQGHLIAVSGNHDHVRGARKLDRTLSVLQNLGATVLRNDACKVCINDTEVWILGLDDPFTLRSDIERARCRLPAGKQPLLLLAHAPVLSRLGNLDDVSLVLCGHTHGGQIRIMRSGDIPGKRLLRWLFRENEPCQDPDLFRGHHVLGSTHLLISDGLGVSLAPLRFRTRPQIVLITLRADAEPRCHEALPVARRASSVSRAASQSSRKTSNSRLSR